MSLLKYTVKATTLYTFIYKDPYCVCGGGGPVWMSVNTIEDILKNIGNQTVDGPLIFSYYVSQWDQQQFVFHILQNILFYVLQKR